MPKEFTVRFAVGKPQGPRGNVWRLWTRKNDVYISAWALTSVQKISLHESGVWRHAFTAEHFSKGSPFVSGKTVYTFVEGSEAATCQRKHCSAGGSNLGEGMASRGRPSVPFHNHP